MQNHLNGRIPSGLEKDSSHMGCSYYVHDSIDSDISSAKVQDLRFLANHWEGIDTTLDVCRKRSTEKLPQAGISFEGKEKLINDIGIQ